MKSWLIGAMNALISGAASAVGGMAIGIGWKKALEIAAISGIVSLSKWMAQHKLPGAPPDTTGADENASH